MKVIDPGHEYLLESYDGEQENRLVFMKREGEGYPFNVGHYAGTNCQEVIRVLIDRVKYLQQQIPCDENVSVIAALRQVLLSFETRAAQRHGRVFPCDVRFEIEDRPTCKGCGHIDCEGKHRHATPQPVADGACECACHVAAVPCPQCGCAGIFTPNAEIDPRISEHGISPAASRVADEVQCVKHCAHGTPWMQNGRCMFRESIDADFCFHRCKFVADGEGGERKE